MSKKKKIQSLNPFGEQFTGHWLLRLLNQRLITILLILAQFVIFVLISIWAGSYSQNLYIILHLTSWLMVILITLSPIVLDYKLSWVSLVLAVPLVGGVLFIILNLNLFNRALRKRVRASLAKIEPLRKSSKKVYEDLAKVKENEFALAKYVSKTTHYPLYRNNDAKYLPQGEIMFEAILEEIRKAKEYIFLEFFILDKGEMLHELLELLVEKVDEGVEVLFLYDDFGTLFNLPRNFPEQLKELGIKARCFNDLIPVLSTQFNHRDHRKIVSVDGKVAFTGGINIADEYINKKERFGHWKDSGVMFQGEAAWAMSLMFLELWDAAIPRRKAKKEDYIPLSTEEILAYCPDKRYFLEDYEEATNLGKQFIQPFGDSPLDQQFIGRMVYKKLIYNADRYLFITTPYLIIDDELVESLCQAAVSGVDVRIITPSIWDKVYVKIVSRSYYKRFIEAGVRIFEYTPGFIHAKTFVSDDMVSVVGTINFDYRSLYLHFEDAVIMYNQNCIHDIREDFLQTQAMSQEIAIDSFKLNLWQRIFAGVLRLFAPLM